MRDRKSLVQPSSVLTTIRRLAVAPLERDVTLTIAALAGLGFVLDDFRISLLAQYLALALFALSLDLIWGYTGILSFGQAAFFGTGAYGVGLVLTHTGQGLLVGVLAGLAAATALAFLVGWFVFYSQVGLFFIAVITLALSVILEQVVNQFSTFTGGFNGLLLPVGLDFDVRMTYFFMLAVLGLVMITLGVLVRSDFGRILVAIRDNEERVRFLGFRTPRVKVSVLMLSGLIAAAGGILYALQTYLVSPYLIGFVLSTQVVIWTAIGGRGTLVGPVLGTIAINLGQEELSGVSISYWQLTLGALLVIVVLFAQDGLYPLMLRITRLDGRDGESGIVRHLGERDSRRAVGSLGIRGLAKRYGSFQALSPIDLDVPEAELLCLIGPNGAGKSTLVDAITARGIASAGGVEFEGRTLSMRTPERVVEAGVCRTFQAGSVCGSLSVFENLLLASRAGNIRWRHVFVRTQKLGLPERSYALMRASGLDQRLNVRAEDLSHGEKKWLELCMVLAQSPRFVLLDEPTAGLAELDRRSIAAIFRALVEEDGLSLVLIEHDLDFVKEVGDRVVVLDRGKLAFDGPVDAAVASPVVRDLYLGQVPA